MSTYKRQPHFVRKGLDRGMNTGVNVSGNIPTNRMNWSQYGNDLGKGPTKLLPSVQNPPTIDLNKLQLLFDVKTWESLPLYW